MNFIKTIVVIMCIFLFSCERDTYKGNYIQFKIINSNYKNWKIHLNKDNSNYSKLLESKYNYPEIGIQINNNQENFYYQHLLDFNTLETQFHQSFENEFDINNIPEGKYLISVYSSEYGFYINNYKVKYGKNITPVIDLSQIIILKDTTFKKSISFPKNSKIIIKGDVTVGEYATMNIDEGSEIIFVNNDNKKLSSLNIYGKIKCIGSKLDPIIIHSLHNQNWRRIKIGEDAEAKFCYTHFYHGLKALFLLKPKKVNVCNCLFNNNETAIYGEILKDEDSFENNLFYNNKYSIDIRSMHYTKIKYNRFYKNNIAAYLEGSGDFKISYNIFKDSDLGLRLINKLQGLVIHNLFSENKIAVSVSGEETKIKLNNFKYNHKHDISITSSAGNSNSNVSIDSNNFFSKDYINVNLIGYSWGQNKDIKAMYNWWNEKDSLKIENRIFDKDDTGPNNYPYTGQVLFMPILFNKLESAGV